MEEPGDSMGGKEYGHLVNAWWPQVGSFWAITKGGLLAEENPIYMSCAKAR